MPDHGCGYDFFTEQELCNGVMNDRVVDGLHKKREPKHWRAKHSRTETKVVARKGIIARVDVQHAHDPNEPLVAGGHDLLEGLSPEERRALLDEAPPRALPPPPADVAPPAGGSLSFSSRPGTSSMTTLAISVRHGPSPNGLPNERPTTASTTSSSSLSPGRTNWRALTDGASYPKGRVRLTCSPTST